MADDGVTVTATNGPAFMAMLARVRKELAEPKDALEAAGRELVAAGSAAAPRATGRLAGSHRVVPAGPKSVRVAADTPYAAVIHWGWPGHGIGRRPWLVATWLRNPAPMAKATDTVQAAIDKAAATT